MNRSDSLAMIAPALVKALAEIGGVVKGKSNPAFKGAKYADLESVILASKPILTEHGLTVVQLPGPLVNGVLTVETVLLHESGEFISGEFGIALGKIDPQGVGSAVSYARRYALMAALNMPAVDDDGEAAHGRAGNAHAPNYQAQAISAPQPATQPLGAPSDLKRLTSARAKEIGLDATLKAAIAACGTLGELAEWDQNFERHTATAPNGWLDSIHNMVTLRAEEIAAEAQHGEVDKEYAAVVARSASLIPTSNTPSRF